ncbi:MAG: copper homeostasis membrane protein CopD [Bradyrhizobium sp.]
MSWFGGDINGPMVVVRAIHFAATAAIAGLLVFRSLVAEPALGTSLEANRLIRSRSTAIVWLGLALVVVTGLIWLELQTMSITGLAGREAITSGAVLKVANETQFGLLSEIRFVLAAILAACLAFGRLAVARWLAMAVSLALVATIAWTGHAGATPGRLGDLHVAADALHLAAASVWLGGLIGLSLLFAARRLRRDSGWSKVELDVVRRFSTLGIISVAALMLTGIINTAILVGSFRGLVFTGYGRLLMVKIAVFAVMVGFAAANRLWVTPRLARAGENVARADLVKILARNTRIELALALTIFAIVGVLGTLHPAMHHLIK